MYLGVEYLEDMAVFDNGRNVLETEYFSMKVPDF